MKQSTPSATAGSGVRPGADPKAVEESQQDTVSRKGGFRNDPDEPTNPNEAIERSRRTVRPRPLPTTTGGRRN